MVRRLLFGACCSLGGLGGLWTAIWSLPVDEPQGPLGADLARLAQPVLERFGVGLACGAAIAFGIVVAGRLPRELWRRYGVRLRRLPGLASSWAVKDSNLQPWD